MSIRQQGLYQLRQTPIRELRTLHGESWEWENLTLSGESDNPLTDIEGDSFEIVVEFEASSATAERYGLRVRIGDDEQTTIAYLPQTEIVEDPAVYLIENPNFETGDISGWHTEGEAFADGDVSEAKDWGWGCCFNSDGVYHLWGYQDGGDDQTGILRSETFILGGTGDIDFLIGGGNNPERLYVALVDAETEEELIRTTNIYWADSEGYTRIFWAVPEFLGREVYIKVVDNATGGWGHINVDAFNVFSPRNVLVVDRTASGVDDFYASFANRHSVQMLPEAGIIRMHLFVDRSSVEIFGNDGRYVLSERIFPDTGSLGLELFALDGEVTVRSLEVHRMGATQNAAISPDIPEDISAILINGDFETGYLMGWTTEGAAFLPVNVVDTECYGNCLEGDSYDQRQGAYFVGGRIENISGLRTGTMQSNRFVLPETSTGLVEFLISGGADRDRLYVALVRASDGKILYRATGNGTNAFERVTWDASQFRGEVLYFLVVDYATNLLGYLNVDDFRIDDVEGIAAQPGTWSFNEESGSIAADSTSGISDPIEYVFNDARYIADSDPMWRAGVVNTALLFNGYATWIERPAAEFMVPVDQLTISTWVAPRSYEWGDAGQVSAIVNQHNPLTQTGYILGMGRHGSVEFAVSISGTWFEVVTEANTLPAHEWSYLVAVVDADAGWMRLYRNGELIAEQTTVAGAVITPSDAPLMIGRHNTAARVNGVFYANMFNGLMDELQIVNYAMNAEDIRAGYQAGLDANGGTLPIADTAPDRSRYDGDPHRPQYHMMPAEHWMNEPHGLLDFDGMYHIFFQHNPQGPYWHQIHWGHQVSPDLVTWTELPPAIAPQANSVAPDGVWSGSAILDGEGNPVLFVTAGNDSRQPNQAVGVATSPSNENPLVEWRLAPELAIDQELDLETPIGRVWGGQFRDPHVWREIAPDGEPIWFLINGSGIQSTVPDTVPVGGTALTYSSRDLQTWEYRGSLFIGDYQANLPTGVVWELPVLLPLGEDSTGAMKHILLVNPWFEGYSDYAVKYVFYWIGTWDQATARFIPDHDDPRIFDYGEHFTGPSGTVDSQGRSILFSIAQDRRSEAEHYDAGWAHNAGLPLVLSLNEDDTLRIEPVPELANLRDEQLLSLSDVSLEEANAALLNVSGDLLEITLRVDVSAASEFGVYIRQSEERAEETLLFYDVESQLFGIDRTRSSLDPDARKGVQSGHLTAEDGILELHIFLDRSMLEAYANNRRSITSRVYPTLADAIGLHLVAEGDVIIHSIEIYSMNGAYGDVAPAVYDEPAPAAGQLSNHSFQSCDLTGWEISGDTFTDAHITTNQDWGWGGSFYQADDGNACHLWGFNAALGGDALKGSLQSAPFTLGGAGQIDFLVAGGEDIERLYVALVRPETGEVLLRATGHGHPMYRRVFWDASAYLGEELVILIVDASADGFGHINVDDINVPTTGIAEPIPTVYRPAS